MKKLMFMLLLAGSIQAMYAQKFSPNTPLFEELTDVKKKTDKFNLYLNMQGSFDAHFQNGFQEGDFNMHQLRIEEPDGTRVHVLALSQIAPIRVHLTMTRREHSQRCSPWASSHR